jgi:hypothetical protein
MRLRHLAGYGALAAALGVACGGRTTDVGSPAGSVQEGGAPRSSAFEAGPATDDAGSTLDASVTVDAATENDFNANCPDLGSIVVDLADGGTCTVPREAEVERSGCQVALPGFSGSCPSDYVIVCGDNGRCPLHLDARCTSIEPSVGGEFCCPCNPGGSSEAGASGAAQQPDAGQVETCQGGCLCFATEEACKAAGCPWNGAYCTNGPIPVEGGSPSGGGGPASCWNGMFFTECPPGSPSP